jgi:hypothetical protein
MKTFFFTLFLFAYYLLPAQYIGVRARYTDTRLVANPGHPPTRENRLILSFYHVTASGTYIPTTLTDYPLYVYTEGLQYGSFSGGVLDSSGNNYPGYTYPAPRAVAYYNSYIPHAIDCDPNAATAYTVNGHELDCGFIRVSHWEEDPSTSMPPYESFTAPNVCLPYYFVGEPYAIVPGNVNFHWPLPATAPYNYYSFSCAGSTQQLVIRGVLEPDTTSIVVLPVHFAFESLVTDGTCRATINWSNLTETDIHHYEVERSANGTVFTTIATVLPNGTSGGRADYSFTDNTPNLTATTFYRIKAIEISGSHFFSVLLRKPNCSSSIAGPRLRLFPNPVQQGRFALQVDELPAGNYEILLSNPLGQLHKVSTTNHPGGTLYKLFDLHWLPPGAYTVLLRSPAMQLTSKVIFLD